MRGNTVSLTVDIQGRVSGLEEELNKVRKDLSTLKGPENLTDSLKSGFKEVEERLKKIKEYTENNQLNLADKKKLESELNEIERKYNSLAKNLSKNQRKFSLSSTPKELTDAKKAMGDYEQAIDQANKELLEQQKILKENLATQEDLIKNLKRKVSAAKGGETKANKGKSVAQDNVNVIKDAISRKRDEYINNGASEKQANVYIENSNLAKDLAKAEQELADAEGKVRLAKQKSYEALTALNEAQQNYDKSTDDTRIKLEGLQKQFDELESDQFKKLKDIMVELSHGSFNFGFNPEEIQNVEEFKQKLQEIDDQNFEHIRPMLEALIKALQNGAKASREMNDEQKENVKTNEEFNKSIDRLKERAKTFFGLTNAIHLFRRAVRSAFSTVKDLDEVMTSMAVVTNYQISDLWQKLPEYTERANKLGVTIHDAYEAMTIFLQQGLEENRALEISNETLKMARIAGLNAADATDRMTNALRGFNMELDATSAQRVDDVYNNLAAKSAANVDDISKAMTKVASLAHSANMEFENTAAFLTQIIETTRESAETAGTALKTVVARFSEVKKLYKTGDLLGSDEEGEEIDVNKISTALRTAGINLNEYFTGAKGLDQIFIDLASKWDDLDEVQKRYIATQAAGSRQQSRFLAMMSDYKRTQELVGYATNANGFAHEQFAKTLDSLKAKLAQLENAWNTFLMGIANNEAIKGIVDIITELVTVINNFTDLLPGAASGISKLLLAFGGLKLSGVVINKIIESLASNFIKAAKNEQQMVEVTTKVDEVSQTTTVAFKTQAAATQKASAATTIFTGVVKGLFAVLKSSLIIAGVTAAIWALQKAFSFFKSQTYEAKMEKLSEQVKALGESSREASEKASLLDSSLESLSQRYKDLNNLTQGTQDWKNAIKEVNTEVQTLIEQFPELRKYLKIENGVLVIDIKAAENESQKYKEAAVSAAIGEAYGQEEIRKKSILKTYGLNDRGDWTGLSWGLESRSDRKAATKKMDEELPKFQEELIEKILNEDITDQEGVENFFNEYFGQIEYKDGKTLADFYNNGADNDLFEKITKLINNPNDLEEYRKGTNIDVAAQLSSLYIEDNPALSNALAMTMGDTFDELRKQVKEEVEKNTDKQNKDIYTQKNTGYATYEEWKNHKPEAAKKLTDDVAKEFVIGEKMRETGREEIKKLEEGLTQAPEYIKNLFKQTEGRGLSQEDLNKINSKDFGAKLKELGINLTPEVQNAIDIANTRANKNRERYGSRYDDFSRISSPTLENVWEKFRLTKNRDAILKTAGDYGKTLTKENQQILMDQIATIEDPSNIKSWENFGEQLESFGFTVDTTSEEFQKFINDMITFNEATRKWQTGKFTEVSKAVNTVMKQLKEGKTEIKAEDYDLIKFLAPELAEQFQKVGENYQLLGSAEEMGKRLSEELLLGFNEASKQGDTSGDIGAVAQSMTPFGIYTKAVEAGLPGADEWLNQLKLLAQNLGVTSEQIEKLDAATLANIAYSYQEAEALGLEKTLISDLANQYLLYDGYKEEELALAYDQAVAVAQLNAGLDPLIDNYENWIGVLWKANDATKEIDKTTPEYTKALGEVEEAVKKILHTTDDIDSSFFDDKTMTIIENISVADSEEELKNQLELLQAKYNDYYVIKMKAELDDGNISQEMYDLVNMIKNSPDLNTLEFGMTLNNTDFLNTLNDTFEITDDNIEEVQKHFDNLGYSVQLTPGERIPILKGYKQGPNAGMQIPDYDYVQTYNFKYIRKKDANVDSSILDKAKENTKGSKGSKEKPNYWKNPYDELYNLNEKINESLRTREALERRYDQLLKSRSSSMKDIREEYKHNIEALREEADLQAQMAEGRLRQIANIGSEVYTDSEGNRTTFSQLGVTKYASYDAATGQITIDWPGLEELEKSPATAKKGEAAEAYISQLEEWVQSYEEVRDKLWEIEDKMEAFAQQVIDSYLNFEDRVLDAVVTLYQKQIDEYSSLSDTIKESNDKILSNLQESIALSRQIRDNTKTEEEIADKEQRLAYLQRDTSGANDLEAMKLQKEIEDARESYQDTLVDQAIEQLGKDNEKAALQREQQIEIMQATLEWEQEQGLLWDEVHTLMASAIDPETGEINLNSDLVKVLTDSEGWIGMSLGKQETMLDDVKKQIAESALGLEEIEAKYKIDANGDGMIVTDSKTQAYLSQIRDMANRYTTQQAHGNASGTSGGSGTVSNGSNSGSGGGDTSTTPVDNDKIKFLNAAAQYGSGSRGFYNWIIDNHDKNIYAESEYDKLLKKLGLDRDKTLTNVKQMIETRQGTAYATGHQTEFDNLKSHTVNFNGITLNVAKDDEGNGWIDEVTEAFNAYLRQQVNML